MKKISYAVFCVIAMVSGGEQLNGYLQCGERCVDVYVVHRRVLTGTPSYSIDFCDKHAESAGWPLGTINSSDGDFSSGYGTHVVKVYAGDACTSECSPNSEATMNGYTFTILSTNNLTNSDCSEFLGS